MAPVEIYLLVAPIVLLLVSGVAVGIFLYVTKDKQRQHTR